MFGSLGNVVLLVGSEHFTHFALPSLLLQDILLNLALGVLFRIGNGLFRFKRKEGTVGD